MPFNKVALRRCRHKVLVSFCVLLFLNLVLFQFGGPVLAPDDPYYTEGAEEDLPRLNEVDKALFVEGHLDILSTGRGPLVHLACLLTEETSADVQVLVKSALLFTTSSLHLHLFTTDETSNQHLISTIKHWPKALTTRVQHTLYDLDCDPLERLLDAQALEAFRKAKDRQKMCIFSNFHQMTTVNHVIVAGPRLAFLSDIGSLWQGLVTLESDIVMYLAPGEGHQDAAKSTPVSIHSGLALVNLELYRNTQVLQNLSHILNSKHSPVISGGLNTLLSQQAAVFPNTVSLLPCHWNYHIALTRCDSKTAESPCPQAYSAGVRGLHGSEDDVGEATGAYAIVSKAIEDYDPRYHKTWAYWNKVFTALIDVQRTQRQQPKCHLNTYGLWQTFNQAVQNYVFVEPDS